MPAYAVRLSPRLDILQAYRLDKPSVDNLNASLRARRLFYLFWEGFSK